MFKLILPNWFKRDGIDYHCGALRKSTFLVLFWFLCFAVNQLSKDAIVNNDKCNDALYINKNDIIAGCNITLALVGIEAEFLRLKRQPWF